LRPVLSISGITSKDLDMAAPDAHTTTFHVRPDLHFEGTQVSRVLDVRPGVPGEASVVIEGGRPGDQANVRIEFDPERNTLRVSEVKPADVGAPNTTSTGGPNPGGRFAGFNFQGGTQVFGNNATVSSQGGRVSVFGAEGRSAAATDTPRIVVKVPEGTRLTTDKCAKVNVTDVKGPINSKVSGGGTLVVSGATSTRVYLSDQATASINKSTGPLDVTAGGQSVVTASGAFNQTNIDAKNQAKITAAGSFDSLGGKVSGQAEVRVIGPVASKATIDVARSATATVNGVPAGEGIGRD
jgi:hypothetical protein